MKQSKQKNSIENTIALYLRISRDDGTDESYSIQNQRKLLQKVAKEKGFTNFVEFVDDGVSGTNKDRKNFKRMIEQVEQGTALFSAVIVKDVTRFARDYIRAGMYIEEVFPENDIRFISIGEGIDSNEGDNPFIGFMNITSEYYSRDISKKRRLSNLVKGNAGEPLSEPPYGYIKDPDNSKKWIIDKVPATVVKRIYSDYLGGRGTEQIACDLKKEKILTPMNYWASIGINRAGGSRSENPSAWNSSTIVKILTTQEYCGDVINFKTYSKSYKLKKRLKNKPEDMKIFKEVHEPIISREDFDRVQQKRGKIRKRKTSDGEVNMFSGLLTCADCGSNLNYHFNQKNHDIKYFNCSSNNNNRGECTQTHYIRVDFLEQIVVKEINRLTKFATQYEKQFAELIMGYSKTLVESDRQNKQKELYSLTARDKDLDVLFNRMYEDNISGKIDDERFARMSKTYSDEQSEIAEKLKLLRAELDKSNEKEITTDMFISTVRKYTRIKKLTRQILNELIDEIKIHHAEKLATGETVQIVTIYWNCVGIIEIPELPKLPIVDVSINTRQGVNIKYSQKTLLT
ncbi:MAG: recombinase family protein [Methanobrevibacter sp.]|jgi:DNA invertase Pin-like site-specific DNA recombinase|nr:recombinase family protein [Candidatus Methanoflexus mossambicus]